MFRACNYFPILNIVVPQVGHDPLVAGFLFFIVVAMGFFISFFDLHFTQYACIQVTSLFP